MGLGGTATMGPKGSKGYKGYRGAPGPSIRFSPAAKGDKGPKGYKGQALPATYDQGYRQGWLDAGCT